MRVFTLVLILTLSFSATAQKLTVSGYVTDQKNGEALVGVHIVSKSKQVLGTTNRYGYYCIYFDAKETKLSYILSFVGYKNNVIELKPTDFVKKRHRRDVLMTSGLRLNEINVNARIHQHEWGSMLRIDPELTRKIASIAGEPDLMKSVQLSPGVTTGSDGSSNLYVRGGSHDQNLVLLDGVPLYYVNHAGGFFSVFDSDAVRELKLYKGDFPARFGGRLSSVLDIQLKEGNKQKYTGSISLGLLASKVSIEGPIRKGKSSFFVSARRCNFDLISNALILLRDVPLVTGYTFYDVNAKLNYKLSSRNRLFLSVYSGDDVMYLRSKGDFKSEFGPRKYNLNNTSKWGNLLGSLRLNHTFNDKLFANLSLSYIHYRYMNRNEHEVKNTDGSFDMYEKNKEKYNSKVKDAIVRWDLDYFAGMHTHFRFGVSSTYHQFKPGDWESYLQNEKGKEELSHLQGESSFFENIAFVESELVGFEYFSMNAGLHFSNFTHNDIRFNSLQPRLSFSYNPLQALRFNIAYSQMKQYLHLLSNGNLGMSYEMWFPSTKRVEPESSTQISCGMQYEFVDRTYSFSIESYYKHMDNPITFRPEESFAPRNSKWEDRVTTKGRGKAYGIEFLLKKKSGRINGHIAYTLSKSKRQFDEINQGKEFDYTYDRPHCINTLLSYKLSKRWTFIFNWTYRSGELATLPTAQYTVMNEQFGYKENYSKEEAFFYSGKHNYRYPSYHRLDITANYSHQKKKGRREWSFAVLNVYNRKNTSFLFYKRDSNGTQQLNRLTMFPLMPSFTYRYFWNQ